MAMQQSSKQIEDMSSSLKNKEIRINPLIRSSQDQSLLESAWKDSLFDD
jgi:hypothetical protein